MAPRVDPVRSDEALPEHADVVIIGGGIIGTSAALFLKRASARSCARRGISPASNRAAIGAGAARWGAIRASCR
jgi:glycine/D-amino acid oxidase-like deaminating enzyme